MRADLEAATSAVFMTYDKLTVPEVEELRASLFAAGHKMRVIPKRLLKLIAAGANLDFDPSQHAGQFAVIWGADAVSPAKTLHSFAKGKDNLKIVAGVLDSELIAGDRVIALAQLPTRDQLLGQLLSVFVGPARGLVTVLSGSQRGLVTALKNLADQKAN